MHLHHPNLRRKPAEDSDDLFVVFEDDIDFLPQADLDFLPALSLNINLEAAEHGKNGTHGKLKALIALWLSPRKLIAFKASICCCYAYFMLSRGVDLPVWGRCRRRDSWKGGLIRCKAKGGAAVSGLHAVPGFDGTEMGWQR
jgi:hypothetical protein